jgi:DnaK suppressor protein
MALKKKSDKKKSISNKTSSKKKAPKKVVGKTIQNKTAPKSKGKKKMPPKAKTKPKAKPKVKPKVKATPKTKPKEKPKTKTKEKSKPKTKTKEKPKTKTKEKSKPKTKQKPKTKPKPKKLILDAETIKIREQLTTNRQELLNIIQMNQSAERNSTESNFSNEIDMASDLEGREMMFQLTSRDLNELKRIQDAIYRIDHGTYGSCDVCSKKISQKRLKILPLSSLCIECKEEMERL